MTREVQKQCIINDPCLVDWSNIMKGKLRWPVFD